MSNPMPIPSQGTPQTFGVPGAQFYPGFETHSPFGSLAAFKGDLVYPVFNIAFFILGVVIVVKVLLSLIGLVKSKIMGSVLGDEILERRRRDAPDQHVETLTNVIMAALDTQECMQRMTCQLGSYLQQYDRVHLLSGIAQRMAPEEYQPQVEAFKQAADCDMFRCGKLVTRKR